MTGSANLFTPARYAEAIYRLAIGVELTDALDAVAEVHGSRFARPAVVLDERYALAQLDRHRSGRFAKLYSSPAGAQDEDVTVRVVEPLTSAGRHLVPRRLRLRLFDDPPPSDPPDPMWSRVFRIALFPGAGAALPSGASVLRGRVVRPGSDGALRPVRWVRVVARDEHDDLGWAHGDDRGEFVLVLGSSAAAAAIPVDPLPIELTVTAPPPTTVDPADVLTALDPLWDLPVQTAIATIGAAADPVLTGRALWPGPESGPFAVDVPLGRETNVSIELPPVRP